MTANLAAYRTDVDDYQANVVDTGPGALRGYLANAKKVEIQGIELDAFARPAPWLDAYANVSWTDAKYTDFTNGPCPLESIGTSTVACDLSGKDLAGVSPWAGSLGGELHRSVKGLGNTGEAYFGADASYRSTYNADASVSKYTEIEGYSLVNLRAGFRSDNGWEAFVFVKNAFDEDYLQLMTVQAGNSGWSSARPAIPGPSDLRCGRNTEVRMGDHRLPNEVLERAAFQDLGQCVPTFEQHETDAANGHVHAVIAGLELRPRGAGRQRQRPVQAANDVGDRNLGRRPRQGIAPGSASLAGQQTFQLEPQHHRLQIFPRRRDVLSDFGDGRRPRMAFGQRHHGPHRIAGRIRQH